MKGGLMDGLDAPASTVANAGGRAGCHSGRRLGRSG